MPHIYFYIFNSFCFIVKLSAITNVFQNKDNRKCKNKENSINNYGEKEYEDCILQSYFHSGSNIIYTAIYVVRFETCTFELECLSNQA